VRTEGLEIQDSKTVVRTEGLEMQDSKVVSPVLHAPLSVEIQDMQDFQTVS